LFIGRYPLFYGRVVLCVLWRSLFFQTMEGDFFGAARLLKHPQSLRCTAARWFRRLIARASGHGSLRKMRLALLTVIFASAYPKANLMSTLSGFGLSCHLLSILISTATAPSP